MNASSRWLRRVAFFAGISLSSVTFADSPKPSAVDALRLAPVQLDVVYERPERDSAEKCTVDDETVGGVRGWVVRADSGQILRRFLDTNGDNKIDQWCYFRDGIEVYRDIDADFNSKADQYRWLGTAGIRWGLDENEDTLIDRWKAISAEEVSSEVVAALRETDPERGAARFKLLLLTGDELKNLGLSEQQTKELQEQIATAANGFRDAARKQTVISKKSQWINFGASQPGVVAAGADGATKDVIVYDNVAAVVETDKKHSQIIVGTLVKVGDVWRMIDLPKNLNGDAEATASVGYFLKGALARRSVEGGAAGSDPTSVSPEMQKLITELDRIDKALVQAKSAAEQAKLNAQRADLLTQLIKQSVAIEDRNLWIRQFAETVAAAAQSGSFPNGIGELEGLERYIAKLKDADELVPFVEFRRMTAEYNQSLQAADADFKQISADWMSSLELFVAKYRTGPDVAEAMLQIAIGFEFGGKDTEAIEWFGKIASGYGDAEIGKKAAGAKRRLESVGKPITLRGKTIAGDTVDLADQNGKVVLIHYWATWCEPCKKDLQLIKELQARYGARGFRPIGVNLDNEPREVAAYLKAKPLSWPQLYEDGGLESRLANELGVHTLPTMILVDSNGKVVNRNIHASELDAEIRKLTGGSESSAVRKTGTKR